MSSATATTAEADFQTFTDVPPATETTTRTRRLPWPRIAAGAVALALTVSGAGAYLYDASHFESTDDSYLQSDVHPVSPRIDGTVARVLVDDNQHVEAGQPLVELDPADLDLALQTTAANLAEAEANEKQVRAQVARARAEVGAATARIARNEAQVTLAQIDFRRTKALAEAGATSRQALDEARAALQAAEASHESLVSAQASAEADLTAARAQGAVTSALADKARIARKRAQLQVDYTVIRAPSAGKVAKKTVEVGARVQPGQPLMAVVSDRVWVVANFKESQLVRMRAGEKAEVKVDALDGRVFHGVVDSISPGTGAEFSLLPPDNATGNFTKIVQRVPVKIVFAGEAADVSEARLFPGLSATVKVGVAQ